jgi:hypothetical protein
MSFYDKKIREAESILIQYGFTRTERYYINPRIKPDIIYKRKSDNGKVVKLLIYLDVDDMKYDVTVKSDRTTYYNCDLMMIEYICKYHDTLGITEMVAILSVDEVDDSIRCNIGMLQNLFSVVYGGNPMMYFW